MKRQIQSFSFRPKRLAGACFLSLMCLFQANTTTAQLNTWQVRPVDSAFAVNWLQSPTFHTLNLHSMPDGGPVMTWDAGNGLYAGIADYAVAWSHTDKVGADTAAMLNAVDGQAYRLFDLAAMQNLEDYADSITAWFVSLGIPVHIAEIGLHRPMVFPNPASQYIQLQLPAFKGSSVIRITDLQSRILKVFAVEGSSSFQKHTIGLSNYPPGVYLISISCGTFLPLKFIIQ